MTSMSVEDEKCLAAKIWEAHKLPPSFLDHLHLSKNPDPAVNSSFRLGSAAQTSIGLSGLSAAYFHALRTGMDQSVTVDARHAVLEFKSEAWYTIDDQLPTGEVWDNIAGLYPTKCGGVVRIHTNFPHHRQGILDILGFRSTEQCSRESVAQALMEWDAYEFEEVANQRGMCATAMRSFEEWDRHPQALSLINASPVSLVKIGDAPKRDVNQCPGSPSYALQGIRVLDLSRVLAGPTCGRTLAAHGADVLFVTSPNLPALPLLDTNTTRGKRTTQLDLTQDADRQTLQSLVNNADVFVQAYRPGSLSSKGYGPEELAKAHPGIVCANLNAWGWDGPWRDRRGFDSLVQTATGFNVIEGEAYALAVQGSQPFSPRPLPVQALDYAAGFLLAFGINAALCRTIEEGGSWEVRVSLAGVGNWIRSMGRVNPTDAFSIGKSLPSRTLPSNPEVAAISSKWKRTGKKGSSGWMSATKHAALLSLTPVDDGHIHTAPIGLTSSLPSWLPN